VKTALPSLPELNNVTGTVSGGTATLVFQPLDDAKDYRVYVLPDDKDVLTTADGKFKGIANAVYRCAGMRQTPKITMDGSRSFQLAGGLLTLTDGQKVGGYVRPLSEATLGFVYTSEGADRMPVHALGNPATGSDLGYSWQLWEAARDKTYVADAAEVTRLVGAGWVDYGIAFYTVASDASDAQPLYSSINPDSKAHYYYNSTGEVGMRKPKPADAAFSVLAHAGTDTQPLMRVFYTNDSGAAGDKFGHDELAAGKPYFDRARQQGFNLPVFEVEWSGMTAKTKLVIEALDGVCPFQGLLTNKSLPVDGQFARWFTFAEIQGAAANHEVFMNGQGDASSSPKPIARSFVEVTPADHPKMDWMSHFETPETFKDTTPTQCSPENLMCDAGTLHTLSSDSLDVTLNGIEGQRWGLYPLYGQLWSSFTDLGGDVPGQLRMTPKLRATMASDKFLHVIMDVNALSTARRYPQILINDQPDRPLWIATRMDPYGHTLTFQPFQDWPNVLQLEVCDKQGWAVNMHCPGFDLRRLPDGSIAPNLLVGEQTSEDKLNRFEIYVSTTRAYMFIDGRPHGCAVLNPASVPSGNVAVTFGDVVYHSGADEGLRTNLAGSFETLQKGTVVQRHFDFMGYSSGVAAPEWPSNLPCATTAK
jgi:hypothetical protein